MIYTGPNDNTLILQTAINNAAVEDGVLLIPAGTYHVGTLVIPSNFSLVGSGIGATTLVLAAGTNAALLQSQGFAGLTGGNTTGGTFNFTVRDMTLDGNTANQTIAAPVVQLYSYGYILQNLRIRNSLGDGLYSEWSTSAGTPGNDSMEAQLVNLKVHNNGANGVQWNGPHDSMWTGGVVYLNGAKGVWVRNAGNGLLMNNVHSWGIGQTYAYFFEGTGCGLLNCVAEGAATAQVFIGANDCWIFGSNVFAAGGATTGIVIGDGTHTLISGLLIDCKVLNCTTAALSLVQDGGGNKFSVNAFQTSGPVSTGTLNANSYANLVVAGGGTGATVGFGGVATTTTAPGAGGAGALPATPAGYVTLTINGVARKVAYY